MGRLRDKRDKADKTQQAYEDFINNYEKPEALTSSAYEDYDPALRGEQEGSMDELRNIFESEGLTDVDKGALDLNSLEAAREARSLRGAAQAQSRRRGLGGSLSELVSSLGANESAINRAYEGGRRNQLAGRDRAFNALGAKTNLASTMKGEDFRRDSAKDTMNQYNQGMFNNWQNTQANNLNNLNSMANNDYENTKDSYGDAFKFAGNTVKNVLPIFNRG